MRVSIRDFRATVAAIARAHTARPIARWDIWSVFDENLPVLWKDSAGASYLIWLESGAVETCVHGHRWLHSAFGFERPAPGREAAAFHRALVATNAVRIEGDDSDLRGVVFTTGDDLAAQYGRKKAERLNVETGTSGGEASWVTCFSLLGIVAKTGTTFIKPHGKIREKDGDNVRRKVSEFLLLSPPTWGRDYEGLRRKVDYEHAELIVVQGPGSAPMIPAVIVGDLAVTGLQGPKGALLVLRLVEYLDSHEQSSCFLPVDPQLGGVPLSVALPLIWPVPLQAAAPWPGGRKKLDRESR